jgi:putative tryptophan/tyrosine transport system substrate-binding protein
MMFASVLLPRAAHARALRRIGFLGDGTAAARERDTLMPFRQGLRALGYVEGRDVIIDARWSEGRSERLAALAAEFVRDRVDVIVTHGLPASLAAKAATTSIPIVVAVTADIVGDGIVASLARPGGNITGSTDQVTELSAKEVQLLTELLPGVKRIGLVWDRSNPASLRIFGALHAAAQARSLQTTPLALTDANQIETLFDDAVKSRVEAVVVVHAPVVSTHRARIAAAAFDRRLPSICAPASYADAGGLMSYGPVIEEFFRRAAVFVDKIFKGAKPADIPVEQGTRFELVINLKTARALGITVPPALLLRATRVVE